MVRAFFKRVLHCHQGHKSDLSGNLPRRVRPARLAP